MRLTSEQKRASDALLEYAMHPNKPYVAMAGYAGTGKTTVMSITAGDILKRNPSASIAFTAPTGKAAEVLRQKLVKADAFGKNCVASTVHKLIYEPPVRNGEGLEWKTLADIDCDLVVVDEASMVNDRMFAHILKFGKPVIFVGDSGQLSPVNGDLFAPLQKTGIRLTEVQRQALDNPIIALATEIRNGGKLPAPGTQLGDSVIVLKRNSREVGALQDRFLLRTSGDDCMALCGKNETRVAVNREARALQKKDLKMPQCGDRVMCLENDTAAGLFNGQIFHIDRLKVFRGRDPLYHVSFSSSPREYLTWSDVFNTPKKDDLHLDTRKVSQEASRSLFIRGQYSPLVLDYAYCVSVHKSQGSEWDNVLLFGSDGDFIKDEENHARWLYTGITRAKKKLIILL